MQPEALFNMGVEHLLGRGVKQDFCKAREYLEQAATHGHVKALACLGILYSSGEGVEQDYIKAKQYYEKAAELEQFAFNPSRHSRKI